MKIDSITLKGWKSYDNNCGVTLDNINKINLIIGGNNSGKSNLSKYLNFLKKLSINKINENKLIQIETTLIEKNTWNWEKKDISCLIKVSKENKINLKKSYCDKDISLFSKHNYSNNNTLLNLEIDKKNLYDENGKLLTLSSNYFDITAQSIGYKDNKYYWSNFLDSLVFIDPIRHHERKSSVEDDFYFDGASILVELYKVFSEEDTKSTWQNYKKDMKKWITNIIPETVINLEITDDNLRLEFSNDLIFSLDELGTGISQIVMLLSYLWLNKEKNLNVFLEEPESNLHPDSVIKLVRIFEKDMKNHTFFITTHSSSLIDSINDKWSVYRAVKNEKSTSITRNDNIIKYYETLNDLGVKASQILQSNVILWVEGPSDRIYIKKWIDIFSNKELIEGKDYSFLFFGGTNLSSFTVLDDIDESLINMLSTSRKSYLITDSDCSSQDEKDKSKYKTTLSKMLDRVSTQSIKGEETDISDYFKFWITDGREIENYVNKNILHEVLTKSPFLRKSIGSGDNSKNLKIGTTFDFNKFDSFDVAIAKAYTYVDGSILSDDDKKNIARSYSNKKVQIGKEIISKLNKENSKSYDLVERIHEVINFIKE